VLPTNRVRPPRERGQFDTGNLAGGFYSPDSVAMLQDCGGFNCVVELSTSTCRQQAQAALHSTLLLHQLTVGALSSVLAGAVSGGPLEPVRNLAPFLGPLDYCGFSLALTLRSLAFPDAGAAALEFDVVVDFVATTPAPARYQATPHIAPLLSISEARPPSMLQEDRASPMIIRPINLPGPTGPSTPPAELRSVHIGSFPAVLRAPLIHRDEPTRCRTRVFADMRRAAWTETPPAAPTAAGTASDLRLVYDACFTGWISQAGLLLGAPLDLPLTPTLSLVGQNLGNVPVPEITDFAVEAFAVQGPSAFGAALAIGFDVMPGCHGIVEHVRHFIGPNPYGLISDEFVISHVFFHKWNHGGLARQIGLQSNVQVRVTQNGQEQLEDAVLFGHANLLSLDYVWVTTDSNTRSDCILFGGQSLAVPDRIQLVADGETFSSSDVDLGPPQDFTWGVNSDFGLQQAAAPDPFSPDFASRAYWDAARHIARPFAFFGDVQPELQVTYVRLNGVSKQMLALGNLNTALE
jgi:hypothetical protein